MKVAIAVGLAACVLGTAGSAAADRRPVVVTTDIGTEVDDLWAVAHLLLTPELEVRAIVTTHAPNLAAPAAEESAKYARELVEKLPQRCRVPVVAGSSRPLTNAATPTPGPGVDLLREAARGRTAENRLTVVVLGAATDVASALLADPTWADRVAIVAMGFDNYPKGGDPWNVKNDVHAWKVLLHSNAPITVGDTDVTRKHLRMTPDRAHTLLAQLPEPGGLLLARFDAWIARNAGLAQRESGSAIVWPIWDEVVPGVLLGAARVETRPRPRLRDDLSFDLDNPRGTIDWVTDVDDGRLWNDLVAKIRAANAP